MVKKNVLFMVFYELTIHLFPLITTAYVARTLGATGMGIYSYTYSLVSYLIVLTQLGVSLYGRREIAKSGDDKSIRSRTFWEIFCVELCMFFISTAIFITLSFNIDAKLKMAFYLQYLSLLAALLDISWLYFGVERFSLAVGRNIFVKIITLILIFIFINSKTQAVLYTLILSGSSLVGSLVMWIPASRFINVCRIDISHFKLAFKQMMVMFIPVLSIQLFSVTDKVFLGWMCDVNQVAIYENVYKIAKIPIALITTINTVLMPRISRLRGEGDVKHSLMYIEKSRTIVSVASSAMAFGIMAIAPILVPIYLGDEFLTGINVLVVLSLTLIPISWGNVFRMQYLLPLGKDKVYGRMVTYAAICNIILNLLLIPRFNVIGAALASLASELMICIYQSVYLRKEFDFKQYIKEDSKYLFSGIIMFGLVRLFMWAFYFNPVVDLVLSVLAGIVIYVLLVFTFEYLYKDRPVTDELKNYLKAVRK